MIYLFLYIKTLVIINFSLQSLWNFHFRLLKFIYIKEYFAKELYFFVI